jgi:hypothetical protein
MRRKRSHVPAAENHFFDNEGVTQPNCEHVRFIFVNGEDFAYIDPDLEQVGGIELVLSP